MCKILEASGLMGYNIHITRATHRTNSEEHQYDLETFKEYFASQDDFVYSNEFSTSGQFAITIETSNVLRLSG
jgi:hypothetical protein